MVIGSSTLEKWLLQLLFVPGVKGGARTIAERFERQSHSRPFLVPVVAATGTTSKQ